MTFPQTAQWGSFHLLVNGGTITSASGRLIQMALQFLF